MWGVNSPSITWQLSGCSNWTAGAGESQNIALS